MREDRFSTRTIPTQSITKPAIGIVTIGTTGVKFRRLSPRGRRLFHPSILPTTRSRKRRVIEPIAPHKVRVRVLMDLKWPGAQVISQSLADPGFGVIRWEGPVEPMNGAPVGHASEQLDISL